MREPIKERIIYALCDPDTREVRYVGFSSRARIRLYNHICEARHGGTTPKCQWIRSLLERDLRPELRFVEEVSFNSWKERECYWIEEFRRQGFDLTNVVAGGGGGNKYRSRKRKRTVYPNIRGLGRIAYRCPLARKLVEKYRVTPSPKKK